MPFTLEKCGFKRREAVIVFEKAVLQGAGDRHLPFRAGADQNGTHPCGAGGDF